MLKNRMRGNSSAMIKGNVSEICPVYLDPECGSVFHWPSGYPVITAVVRDTIKDTPCIVCYHMIIAQSEARMLVAHPID
jgi:hypothetical protein